MKGQMAQVTWRDGSVPVSVRFDDPYYSLADGLAEARQVFLAGNGLPARFGAGFHIAELGFGTGLNMLAAWAAWRQARIGGTLSYTSFEAWPMPPDDIARALAAFGELDDLAGQFLAVWNDQGGRFQLEGLDLVVIAGDARTTLPGWDGRADAWFLDGFAPAKNPELWEPGLLAQVAGHTAPGGTAATYSAAGAVRRALSEAGFAVSRTPGHGRKRHMTRAVLEPAG